MKQVYKGEILTTTKTVNKIVKTFLKTSQTDRYDWYLDAHNYAKYLAETFNISVIKAAGIIAALSPLKRWDVNKKIAYNFIKYGGKSRGHMHQFMEKSRLILETAVTEEDAVKILNGRKIVSFFLNILHPNDDSRITIDRHALTIATGTICTEEFYAGMTKIQYDFFVKCYKIAAKKLGVSALLVQSATWVYYRNNKQEWR